MPNTELCPWCSSVISRDKFLAIEAKIRAEEKNKLQATEATMRKTLHAQFASEYEKRRQVREGKLQAENDKAIAKLVAERDAAAKKLKDTEAREVEIRKHAEEEATKVAAKELEKQGKELQKLTTERDAAAKKLKDAESRETEIRKQARMDAERASAKELEKRNREVEKLVAERDEAAQKVKDAEAREAKIRREVKGEAEKVAAKELQKQREILEKDRDAAVLKKQAEFNREREGLQSKVKVMERQLQSKTANQLGDGAEIDIYDALREVFQDDHINRVPKGQSGADIIYDVMHNGKRCGRIVIDSKNHQSWKSVFVSKLREDQIDAQAEHAILSSNAFPAGKKEMCIESNVIVISPARVIYVIELLRRTMITMHVQGLSMKSKADKMSRLYKLITSESYAQRFSEATKLTDEILALDVDEQKAHSLVWKKRGSLSRRMLNVLREIETDVEGVIEGGVAGADEAIQSKLGPSAASNGDRREAI